jgi:hypothetical protein
VPWAPSNRSTASQLTPAESRNSSAVSASRDALDLAVAELMLAVGGLAGDAHREIGEHGGGEIEQGMRGFRENRQRAGQEPDHGLGRGEPGGSRDRAECHAFLVVRHRGLPRDRYRRGEGASIGASRLLEARFCGISSA